MNQDPSIDDRMTASGYVRCGGCGGYLPAGAICGYCLQRQQAAAQPAVAAPKIPPKTHPWRTGLLLALCALVVCAIGLGAIFLTRGAKSILANKQAGASSPALANATGMSGDTMSSQSNEQLMAALQNGDTEKAMSMLESKGSDENPTMQATAPESAPTLQNTSPAAAPTLEAAKGGMPDDVRKWLEHLQKTEQARNALATAQLQSSLKTLMGLKADGNGSPTGDEDDPAQEAAEKKRSARAQQIGGDMQSMQQSWKTLLATFDSMPAPAECVGIKGNYDQVIGETGKMIMQIISQIKSAANDPQGALAALTGMQGTSKGKIDVPAQAADDGVTNLCNRYNTSKWFSISSDVGSGSMAGLGF